MSAPPRPRETPADREAAREAARDAALQAARAEAAVIDAAYAEPRAADPVTRRARAAALATLAALVALGLAWELWLAPTGRGTWAIKVLPLLLCVAGLLRHRMVTFRWLSLLVWLYFAEGITRAWTEDGVSAALAWGQTLLSVVLFGVCAFYIRWRLRRGAALAAQARAAAQAAGAR
jgi:uncharacterized membrane protein